MDNVRQIVGKKMIGELHSLKRDVIKSNSRVDKLEIKLGIAYDELARNKEDFTRIISYR